MNLPTWARRLGPALRPIALVFTIVAALKQLVWPAVHAELFAKPAVAVTDVVLTAGAPGTRQPFILELDVLRQCQVMAASLVVVDAAGREYPAEHSLSSIALPTKRNQRVRMSWVVPPELPAGKPRGGYLELAHYLCLDGPGPATPATFHFGPPVDGAKP